jgi:hypothetical protein
MTMREYEAGCGAGRARQLRKLNGIPADEIPIGFVVINLTRFADRGLTLESQPLGLRDADTANIYGHRVVVKAGEFA